MGPDTGIAQKVQDLSNSVGDLSNSVGDLSNNLLTSNNDASLNNVDISGNLKVNGLAYSIPHILEINPVELSSASVGSPYAFGTIIEGVDTANGWDSTSNKYTIPTTGYWHVTSIIGGRTNGSANFTHSINHYNALAEATTDIAKGRALFFDLGSALFETTGNDASTIRYLYSGDKIWFSIDSISTGTTSQAFNNNFFGDGGKLECGFRAFFLRK